jgi:hypothetical protein
MALCSAARAAVLILLAVLAGLAAGAVALTFLDGRSVPSVVLTDCGTAAATLLLFDNVVGE